MTGEIKARSWNEAFRTYLRPRVIVMLFLGFSAGLPFMLIFGTLSAWLREAGVSRTEIGFFSWVGLMYSIKFFWAPVIDRMALPGLAPLLGQRRSWLVLAQCGIAIGLVGISLSDPGSNLLVVALLALLVAFSSATQDVVVDAFRIESADTDQQGAMASTYQTGYRVAILASYTGALFIAEFVSWTAAYATMAVLMGVGLATAFIVPEPDRKIDQATRDREAALAADLTSTVGAKGPIARALTWVSGAVVSPFTDYFSRTAWLGIVVLVFIGLYRLSDITMGIMAKPFYIDLGFTKGEIAAVTGLFGLAVTLIGTFVGGLVVVRYGIMRPLLFGAILMIPTNLVFAWLASQGPDVQFLAYAIAADNFTAGFAGTCLIAYLSSLVNQAYTATQYALFSSFFTLPGKFLGGFSGVIVDQTSYEFFFTYAASLGIPAVLLCLFLMRYGDRLKPAGPEVEPEPETQTGEGGKAPAGA